MAGHGHSHGDGGCGGHGHSHDHDHDEADQGNVFSLYLKIDTANVECLNESTEGSGKEVFKPWDQRLDREKFVESDADEELLFNIPFTGNVKLKGIMVIGGPEDQSPSHMRLYKNRPNMTFDEVGIEPEQEFELNPDPTGIIEYTTKVVKFSSIQHLTIHFPRNFGADTTLVYYIGLRGDFTEARRSEITITNYEAWANPADHKTNLMDNVGHQIS